MNWNEFFQAYNQVESDSDNTPDIAACVTLIKKFTGADRICILRWYQDSLCDLLFASPSYMLPGVFPCRAAAQTRDQLIPEELPQSLRFFFGNEYTLFSHALFHPSLNGWILISWNQPPLQSDDDLRMALRWLQDKILLQVMSQHVVGLNQQLESRFRMASQGLIQINEIANSVWLNPAAADLLELPNHHSEHTVNSVFSAILALLSRSKQAFGNQLELMQLLLDPNFEIKDRILDLGNKVISVTSHPIRTNDFRGRQWMFNDISELFWANRHLMEQHNSLTHKNEELAEVNREIESLISVIAHDLKSPLATIAAIFHSLMSSHNLDEEQQENIEYGLKTVRRGVDLINSIVFYNSLVYSEQPLQISEIELDDLIESLISGYQVQAIQKDITLHVNKPPQPIILHSDFELVVRILDNLISNALKFTPIGRNIYISVDEYNERCYISIRDEGPGIQPDERHKLFKRFQRLSARPTNNESSSGLGLSIVKALSDKLGATIEVDSPEIGGTVFRLGLPLRSDSVPEPQPVAVS
ncbi:sensor histidine kinase [Tellurirhabdus rosea]|uniref:sensor histidine kinase n=1 Tax=Tellurirhabdus rosea TaxID=2674997 RepID=UPI00224E05EA|nr:HAMP domain-containing sensor histidine kinase [Tellurirhabdus rosea]